MSPISKFFAFKFSNNSIKKLKWILAICLILDLTASSFAASESPTIKEGKVFRDCLECPEMIVIPEGDFVMGSSDEDTVRDIAEIKDKYQEFARLSAVNSFSAEHPQHSVSIRQNFAMSKYTIKLSEYKIFHDETNYLHSGRCIAFFRERPPNLTDASWSDPGFKQAENEPVVCVSRLDAQEYINWLNKKVASNNDSRKSKALYRLPSEAEWEYAARAGTTTARWWGDFLGVNKANCINCGSHWDYLKTAPVGSFEPNPFGLYDMLGNVSQWVADCWNANYLGAPDGTNSWQTGDCEKGIVRGGSWDSAAWHIRSADRKPIKIETSTNYIGFRVVRYVVQ